MLYLKQIVKNGRVLFGKRAMGSTGSLVNVEVDEQLIATMTMQRSPVNSLNLELIQDISKALDDVGRYKWKGMILTSSLSSIFSAGLDIEELYKPDDKRLNTFWKALQQVWIKLFGADFITAAAINGHAPAGGCLLAMSCEYRVMVEGKFTIGMNEAALGVAPPTWVVQTMQSLMPQRQVELALTTGRMFSVDEALEVGLIDETATDKADSIEKCKTFIKTFDNISPVARAITKQKIRQVPLAWMDKYHETDMHEFIAFLKTPNVQRSLEMYIEAMKEKTAKKKAASLA